MTFLATNFRKGQYLHRFVQTLTVDSAEGYMTFSTGGIIDPRMLTTHAVKIYLEGGTWLIATGPPVVWNLAGLSIDSTNNVFYLSYFYNVNGSMTSGASLAATLSGTFMVEILIGSR